MTVTYHTIVLHLPPTPHGLLPERWKVQHSCNLCRQRVAADMLVAHAQDHEQADSDKSLPNPVGLRHNDDTKPEPYTDHRRR